MSIIAIARVVVSCLCLVFCLPLSFWMTRKAFETKSDVNGLVLVILSPIVMFGGIVLGSIGMAPFTNEKPAMAFIMLGFFVSMVLSKEKGKKNEKQN